MRPALQAFQKRRSWIACPAVGLSLLMGSLAGCDARPAPDSDPTVAETPALAAAIEYAGCAEVLGEPVAAEPVCVLPADRALRLWLPEASWVATTDAPVEIPDVSPLVVRSRAMDGGRLLWITVPEAASRLDVRPGGEADSPAWSLALADSRDAETLAVDSLSAEAREGYLALRRGHFARAAEILDAVHRQHAAAGRRLTALSTAANVVFCHVQERRLDRARAVLESFALGPRAPAEARFQESYYRGILATLSGDARTALEALDEASRRARRLGMERESGMSGEMQALHLRRLGRARESAALFESLRRDTAYDLAADRARLLHNYAWSLLLAREAGETPNDDDTDDTDDAVDLLALLEEVRESFDGALHRVDQQVNVRLNLALAHLQAGRPDRARESLDEAAELTDEPPAQLRSWWLDLEARIALAEGRVEDALALYERLERLAESAFDPESRRRAKVGRARALVAAGRPDAARAALVEAERLLDDESQWIPLDQGRETFVAGAGDVTRLLLDLLLHEGRDAEAFETARRSRSRVLRGLQYRDRLADLDPVQRRTWEQAVSEYHRLRARLDEAVDGDWRLSADQLDDARRSRAALDREITRALDRAFAVFGPVDAEAGLPPTRPGEVTLLYHPLPRGWVGFAALDGEVASRRLELPALVAVDPAVDAAVLVEPFEPRILAAERVRVLPFGELRRVDFHALPFGDDLLVSARPVVYGLDVIAPAVDSLARRALIVADPRGDLPAAGREAERVRRALRRARPPWTVGELRGDDARARAVLRELPAVDLFHYAGHGVFSGRAGWESTLPLAAGSRLTLGDLLALERAPARVVLSACDAARASSSIGVEGLGLAHGFVLAGARQVVAADRPVEDVAAAALVEALYREPRRARPPDLAEALRRAQLERRRAGDDSWAAFRVLEP